MDMSFATQALSTESVIKNEGKLSTKVYTVPEEIENWLANLKLKIDQLTAEQTRYLDSWEMGT